MIFSGDGDFRCVVEAAQRKGVRVTVVSTVKSAPPMVADELRRQSDHFIELQDIADQIARIHTPRESMDEDDEEVDIEAAEEAAFDVAN